MTHSFCLDSESSRIDEKAHSVQGHGCSGDAVPRAFSSRSIQRITGECWMHKRLLLLVLLTLASFSILAAQAPQPDPKDPQFHAKGDQKRAYLFPGTGESIPYHLYVPSKWTATTRLPLVVVTHGASQPADAPFQRGDGAL